MGKRKRRIRGRERGMGGKEDKGRGRWIKYEQRMGVAGRWKDGRIVEEERMEAKDSTNRITFIIKQVNGENDKH